VTTAALKPDVRTPAVRWMLAQSAAESQILVRAQSVHVPPPQSTSVTALFLVASAQPTQTERSAASQIELVQSLLPSHLMVSAHASSMLPHSSPPQSTSSRSR
jgi:hypothetical protein